MDTLIQDALEFLQEAAKTTPSVFTTAEERAYFAPLPKKTLPIQKKETVLPAAEKKNFTDLRKAVQKTFPELSLRETIPDDAVAKKMSRLWEESYLAAEVVVIAFGEVGPGIEFLKQVTAAIDKLLAPAQFIEGSSFEKERGWDLLLSSPSLKAVVCSPWASWKITSLSKHYRQNGSSKEQFLGPHPLLLLEPSLTYLKHPDRKRELWKALNTQLSS